jgi:hypothetical protein
VKEAAPVLPVACSESSASVVKHCCHTHDTSRPANDMVYIVAQAAYK